jgi:hypothetical protein
VIEGRLVPVVGPQVELKTSTFSLWEGFPVGVRAGRNTLEISRGRPGPKRQAPIINVALDAEFLLGLIGNGQYHQVDGKYGFGVKLHQEALGTVDLIDGIDAQRDGPDRHHLQSLDFTYQEYGSAEGEPRGFTLLFDIVYGNVVSGQRRSRHANVAGQRKWVRCDTPWSMLYDFHEWAVREQSDRPGELLRERLGLDVCRPDAQALS